MRGLSRKQVSAKRGLWVRVPRLPLWLHRHSKNEHALRYACPGIRESAPQSPRLRFGLVLHFTNPKRQRGLLDRVELPDDLTASVGDQHSPVVQRQRLLAYTQATMVRVHPGL